MSAIVMRQISSTGVVKIRRLHPVEAFRMNLWDLEYWNADAFAKPEFDFDLFQL